MDFKNKHELFTIMLYASAGAVCLGVLLLIIFIIAQSAAGIVISILFTIMTGTLFGFSRYWWTDMEKTKKICVAIKEKNVTDVSKIAAECHLENGETRRRLDYCFKEKLLEDYVRVGDSVVPKEEYSKNNSSDQNDKQDVAVKCPSCGASFVLSKDVAACPYCGTYVNKAQ